MENNIEIFINSDNQTQIEVKFDEETVWLTLNQISELFDRDKSVISRHLKNIFKEEELDIDSVVAKNATTAADGKVYQVDYYNLDAVLSVGYRVNSKKGTQFRIWASKRLKDYLLKGYTINTLLLEKQKEKISELQTEINILNEKVFETKQQLTEGLLSIILHYSKSFHLLNKYDSHELSKENLSSEIIYIINYSDVKKAILALKKALLKKGEASELFGNEKDNSFEGILGSISQTVFGELAYPTIEEQAAQLLYSIIKGHAFSDGNKRIGSFIFVWFLEQNNYHLNNKGNRKISENTLVTLALAVAQSKPDDKESIIRLICNLIADI
ncbi:MAG: type II toxin-antitoxin system death-on-curing family toxin [Flavobacteriales bacterium]|nr:type II toxin-antitoxin system death-on-curing family toxin [Flavobacteriales bacterium]